MGRFSVERSMNVSSQTPQPSSIQQQYSSSPYNYGAPQQQQQMPQQQQQLPAGWPTFFPKETIGLDRGVFLNDTKQILTSYDQLYY